MNRKEAGLRSGAFPNTHCQAAAEEHVQQILYFISHLESKTFADDHMPGTPKFLIHGLLYHLSCTLKKTIM